jgi:hypothetical protein
VDNPSHAWQKYVLHNQFIMMMDSILAFNRFCMQNILYASDLKPEGLRLLELQNTFTLI